MKLKRFILSCFLFLNVIVFAISSFAQEIGTVVEQPKETATEADSPAVENVTEADSPVAENVTTDQQSFSSSDQDTAPESKSATESKKENPGIFSDVVDFLDQTTKIIIDSVPPLVEEVSEAYKEDIEPVVKEHVDNLHRKITKAVQDTVNVGIDARDEYGNTVLMRAVLNPQLSLETLNNIFSMGADINKQNNNGDSVLMLAVSSKTNDLIFQALMNQNPKLNVVNEQGHTILTKAVITNSKNFVTTLIANGANTEIADKHGNPPLFYAVDADNLPMTELLLNLGADLRAVNHYGQTAFFRSNSILMTAFLRSQGFTDLKVKDADGNTLLMKTENPQLAMWLIDNGADISDRNNYGHSALSMAVDRANVKLAKLFLFTHQFTPSQSSREGADQDKYKVESEKAYLLFNSKSIDTMSMLLREGVDIDVRDSKGNTLFLLATERGDRELMNFVHSKGADINTSNIYGETALIKAIKNQDISLVEFLLALGVDVNNKGVQFYNIEGKAPLVLAIETANLPMLEILLHWGADIELRDNKGETILMKAVRSGSLNIVRFLLERDLALDITAVNNKGEEALDIAKGLGFEDITAFLQQQRN